MAKLYFYYSSMNAGKSTILLQSSYNYQERGMNTLVLTPELDTRFAKGMVASRIGLKAQARTFNQFDDLLTLSKQVHEKTPIHCLFVDEAQFLTRQQVKQLSDVCDFLEIPVLAYGLRTDFQGICSKAVCNCWPGQTHWSKSRRFAIVDEKPHGSSNRRKRAADQGGSQVQIGGNERYMSVCRIHFKQGMATRRPEELPLTSSVGVRPSIVGDIIQWLIAITFEPSNSMGYSP